MDSRNKRLSKAVTAALVFHVLAAAVIGALGIQNRETCRPGLLKSPWMPEAEEAAEAAPQKVQVGLPF